MSDQYSKQATWYERFREWYRKMVNECEESYASMTIDDQATFNATGKIIAGILMLFFCFNMPHVSFDSPLPGETDMYPMGESISQIQFITPIVFMHMILCVVFAVRYRWRRTAWSYRLMWFFVIILAIQAFGPLAVLDPGRTGYSLWAAETYGYAVNVDMHKQARAQGVYDAWDGVTKVNYFVLLFYIASGCMILHGAWCMRSVRHADLTAPADNERPIIDERRAQDE